VQQAGRVHHGLLAGAQPGRARELVRVVRDRRGVAGGVGVAQRQRLQQQPEHPFVADVQLVRAALDLLAVRLALEQRAQQELADAEGEREQPDDALVVDLEAVDGHRRQQRRGELPREHGQVHRAEQGGQRAAAQQHVVAGDQREVERVDGDEDAEHRDRVAGLRIHAAGADPLERERADQREGGVGGEVVEQQDPARAAAQRVADRAGDAHRDGRGGTEQGHRQDQAEEGPGDPEALGLEGHEVAAHHQDRQQADERDRVPLLLVREEHRGDRDRREQRALADDEHAAPRSTERRDRALGRPRGLADPEARVVLRSPGSAHQGQRPADDDQPQGHGEPDDHSIKVVA
jgi:hypothetical protein